VKVLIIDDEEISRYLLEQIFREHRIISVSDGETGLKIFFRESFNLVIVDRNMPGMLGEEVIRKIKLSNPQVKAILISDVSGKKEEEEVRRVAKSANADYFVNKSSLLSGLNAALKDMCPVLLSK
jgi:CheY-like chemotaxis protein